LRFCDEQEFGFGWIEADAIGRTSHALVVNGGVWLIDPVDWPEAEQRALELGEVRGVLQLLDRHERDSAALAGRLSVPRHVVPRGKIDGAPFEFLPIAQIRIWREVALWWPERRVLVCADAVGTLEYFRARGEPLGVNPLLRLWPPRSLRRVFPEHVLSGHGEGVHQEAAQALHRALRTARRRLPAAVWGAVRRGRL
jgi:hypothetical protein